MSGSGARVRTYSVEALLGTFSILEPYDVVVLAVSGGSDSTALLHIASAWNHERQSSGANERHVLPPDIVVATVDHGLREGSANEAADVGRAAGLVGFPHKVLTITKTPDGPFSQSWARTARYDALVGFARAFGAARVAIVTAHTQDDQAETVLMRLARGSGVDGLGGMRPVVTLNQDGGRRIDLVRPLLDLPKTALMSLLDENGIDWADDPSNEHDRFERVRLRAARTAREALGLGDAALARTAKRAQRASTALDGAASRAVREAGAAFVLSPLGYADFDRDWFDGLDEELRLRILGRLVTAVGGQTTPVSLGSLEDRMADFEATRGATGGFTLGGAIVEARIDARGRWVRCVREPLDARSPPADICGPIPSGSKWDNRFSLMPLGGDTTGMVIGALGQDGVRELESAGWVRTAGVPARVIWTQPAIRSLNGVRWAPTLDYGAVGAGPSPLKIDFDWSGFDPARSSSRLA